MRCARSEKRFLFVAPVLLSVRVSDLNIGKYVSSSELAPGDVYEVSDPNLTQFPSDSLLLTGDCIVNESMLTGTN